MIKTIDNQLSKISNYINLSAIFLYVGSQSLFKFSKLLFFVFLCFFPFFYVQLLQVLSHEDQYDCHYKSNVKQHVWSQPFHKKTKRQG